MEAWVSDPLHLSPLPRPIASAEPKCCAKCAFRSGSPERTDPYAWMRLVEAWTEDGVPFGCHESAPGHPGEVQDGSPRYRLCRGYVATRHLPPERLHALAQFPPDFGSYG